MKKTEAARILVIGASGNFGASLTPALATAGHHVRALRRAGGRPIEVPGVRVVEGSALDAEDVRRAAAGVDVIVHAFNVPYPEWDKKMFAAAAHVVEAAVDNRALLVLPGNVYGLDPASGQRLPEDCARAAPSLKSELRNRLEAQLEAATERGAKLLIVRAGDYMGPGATNTWFNEMTKRALSGGALQDPGRQGVLHDWAYLPDLAVATERLIARRDELGPSEVFNFSSFQLPSRDLLEAVNEVLPSPRPVRAMPWWLLRPLSPFVPMLRELFDVKYLWDQQLLLDDSKLERFLGDVPRTPLPKAARVCLGLDEASARVAA